MAIRVLIVDDSGIYRAHLRRLLERGGYEVAGEAADGAEAVKRFRQLRPAFVLMDLEMPVKSGIVAIREIRARDPKAFIIACSSHDDKETVLRVLSAGARDFIPKGTDDQVILECLALYFPFVAGKRSSQADSELRRRKAPSG